MSGETFFVENVDILISLLLKLSKIKKFKLRGVQKFKLV